MYKPEYFSLYEAIKTSHGIANNIPTWDEIEVILHTCMMLDAIREKWGSPIIVNSFFRSEAVNKAAGGVSNSQHRKGEAADLTLGSKEKNKKLYEFIRDNFDFDQLINEYDYSWIHVSFKFTGINRKQELVIK